MTEMPSLDPEVRSLAAATASNARYAQLGPNGRRAATQAAREAVLDNLRREVDPNGELDPADREARVASLRRAQLAKLSLLAVQAKRAKAAKRAAEQQDAETAKYVQALVDAAPPLSDQQKAILRALLAPGNEVSA